MADASSGRGGSGEAGARGPHLPACGHAVLSA